MTWGDLNDAFLLAMALGSQADYLVTGDRRAGLLERGSAGRTRIVTPAGFLRRGALSRIATSFSKPFDAGPLEA